MSDPQVETKTKVYVFLADGTDATIVGSDLDFGVDENGILSIWDNALTTGPKPLSGKVFVAAPSKWAIAQFLD